MELMEKVAIVTGATGMIGRAICRALAGKGMRVAVADLSQDACDGLADEIHASGGSAMGISVDVTKKDDTRHMARKVMDALGRIDALINNAGIIRAAPLADFQEADFDRVISVNLKGPFLCAQAVVPFMIERNSGTIVNISSVAAKRPAPLQTAYAASKHGLMGFTQVWCQELAPHHIRVNTLCPGFIDSPMWTEHLSPAYAPIFGVEPSKLIETIAKMNMPLGRPQTPEEIGEAVVFLCGADMISGQALAVDGGYTLY